MLQAMTYLGQGFSSCLTPINMFCCIIGVLVGTLAGVLPGLGISGSVAILLPITYSMEPLTALIMVSGIFFGSQYGGAITSILVNIPGEATSIVTCFDGYPLAKKGLGGKALGVSAISSFCGGTVGLIFLTLAAPQLARLAVTFGAPEFFAIVVFGLLLLTNVSGKDVLKGTVMVFCGLMLGCIGLDSTFGTLRYTFNNVNLYKGIDFIIFIMGVFGITELMYTVCVPEDQGNILSFKFRELYPSLKDLKHVAPTIARSSLFGFSVGLIPGPGSMLATFGSYGIEKKLSKHPEEFGKGVLRGVAAPESANNASMYYDHWGYTGDNAVVSDLQAAIFKGWQYNQNFAKYNPAEALLSDTYMEIGSDLDRIRNDAMEKYVMGEITLDEYMGEVQKWYDFGGSKVVAEYEAAFAASK